jgi:prefoldin subunit 5
MVNYSELPYLMLQAIKDLKSENDTLKEQNAALARALQDQQTRLQAIELRLERTATQRTAEAKGH